MSTENPFRSYAQERDKELGVRTEQRSEGPSLPEIIKKESRQFGAMLEAMDDPEVQELGARLMSNNLEAGDTNQLARLRAEYLERKEDAKNLVESIRGEYFNEVIKYSPQLRELCDLWGEKNVEDLLCKGVADHVMSDREGFNDLFSHVQNMKQFEETKEADINKRISEFCQIHNLSASEVVQLSGEQNYRIRVEKLRVSMREQMGVFNRLVDHFSGKSRKEASSVALNELVDVRLGLEERTKFLKGAGGFVASLINDNELYRGALATLARENKIHLPHGVEGEQQSFGEVYNEKPPTPQQWQQEWQDWIAADTGRRGRLDVIRANPVDGSSVQDLRNLQEQFGTHQSARYQQAHRGFWASIFAAIFGASMIDKSEYQAVMK